jgi:hypothetical protein
MRELIRRMRGICRAVIIRLMTLPAIGVLHVVISPCMTGDAGLRYMSADQRKLRAAVIESGRRPGDLIVAGLAIMRELI